MTCDYCGEPATKLNRHGHLECDHCASLVGEPDFYGMGIDNEAFGRMTIQ